MQVEKKAAEEAAREAKRKAAEDATARAQAQQAASRLPRGQTPKRISLASEGSLSEADDSNQDSSVDFSTFDITRLPNEDNALTLLSTPSQSLGTTVASHQSDQQTKPVPPTSPLLSSLLQSKHMSADSLQQLKNKAEQAEQQQQLQQLSNHHADTAVSQAQATTLPVRIAASMMHLGQSESLPTSPSCAAPTLSKLLFTPAQAKLPLTTIPTSVLTPIATPVAALSVKTEGKEKSETQKIQVKQETVTELPPTSTTPSMTSSAHVVKVSPRKDQVETKVVKQEVIEEDSTKQLMKDPVEDADTATPKDEGDKESQDEDDPEVNEINNSTFISVDDEVSIKEEPPSPASSVSSRVSESGGKSSRGRRRRGRGSRGGRRGRPAKRPVVDDDKKDDASSKHSEAEITDDDMRESDDQSAFNISASAPASILSESIPNSPASLSMCSDTEDEKAYKTWKKSIMLVWRSAANHKYANVFLHPVTHEIAPGYRNVVHRPMDLGTIKKNIEAGILRTTPEFQRDMMLMFTNAVMYNSSNHDVFKMAMEMYNDVMQHIEQYVSTQLMVQSNETKILRQSRRTENQEKEDESKKRRTSSEQPPDGGKTKKRKTRADDT